jgi:hypothetical protein
MKNIRIGNDIVVTWSILRDGAPFSLEGKVVTIYLKTPFGKDKAERFSISNNQVIWTFLGKNQKSIGKYSLELIVNEGAEGMITTDYCNFVNLVSCSCKEGGEDEGSVQTESIALTSNILLAGSGEGGGGSYDDTKIKQDIADLQEKDKATDVKLTELSAEVSGLSEKVENLPTAESSVFEAVFGETTYEEIVAANNEGKVVICKYGLYITRLTQVLESLVYFDATSGNQVLRVTCYNTDAWTYVNYNTSHKLETLANSNVQLTIAGNSSEVATPQYVENLLGVIINGDY